MLRFYCFLFCLISPKAFGVCDKPLIPYQANYEVKWHGISVGLNRQELKNLYNNRYFAKSDTKPKIKGLPFQYYADSYFSWDGTKSTPIQYQYEKLEGKRKKQGSVVFNQPLIHWTKPDQNEDLPWQADLQDKISHMFQLQRDIQCQKPPFNYKIMSESGLETYTFLVEKEEQLQTALGVLNTLKLKQENLQKDRLTFLWLAKDKNYIIVKLEQYKHQHKVGDILIKGVKFTQDLPESKPINN